MEQRYWKQFMDSGKVCDYLQYRMEQYGHRRAEEKGSAGGLAGRAGQEQKQEE